jgi:hypothetical protein
MRYALPTKKMYPIETVDQVKTASAYFDKYLDRLHPAERVAIADNMEKRASDLGMHLENPWLYNYSTKKSSYSPEFDMHMRMRKEACAGRKLEYNGKEVKADELLEKVAKLKDRVKPKEMIEMLNDFDKKAGLASNYDKNVRDPFFTVYGSSINPMYDQEKIASDMYAVKFEKIAKKESFLNKLAQAYGQSFADGFKGDPLNIYKSMPSPDKQNIVNIAREESNE